MMLPLFSQSERAKHMGVSKSYSFHLPAPLSHARERGRGRGRKVFAPRHSLAVASHRCSKNAVSYSLDCATTHPTADHKPPVQNVDRRRARLSAGAPDMQNLQCSGLLVFAA